MGGKSNGNSCTCCFEIDTEIGDNVWLPRNTIYLSTFLPRKKMKQEEEGENLAMISSPVTEVNLLLNLAAVSGTRGRRRRELVVASSSASQALNLCAHHPHINSVHRFSRMVMRLGNLSHRICPNSFRTLGSQSETSRSSFKLSFVAASSSNTFLLLLLFFL